MIPVDEEILRQAQVRASEQGSSVALLVQSFLEGLARENSDQRQAIERVLSRSRSAASSSEGRSWTREELHDRAGLR